MPPVKVLPSPKVTQPWRLSSSVILAAPKGKVAPPVGLGPTVESTCDYRVCLLKRTGRASFMANAMVFPGGAIDAKDRDVAQQLLGKSDQETIIRIAAAREAFEEAGIHITKSCNVKDPAGWRAKVRNDALAFVDYCRERECIPDITNLSYWCTFITPDFEASRVKKGGFDARFYLFTISDEACKQLGHASSDQGETVSLVWMTPEEALAAAESGSIFLAPPQWIMLKWLSAHPSIDTLPAYAASSERTLQRDHPIKPYPLAGSKDSMSLAMPGDEAHPVFPGPKGGRHRIVMSTIKIDQKTRYTLECNIPGSTRVPQSSHPLYGTVGLAKL